MTVDRHPGAEVLGAFMDGQLPSGERREVVVHLGECDRCVGFLHDAHEALQALDVGPDAVQPRVGTPTRWRRWAPLAVAAVLTTLFVGLLVAMWRGRASDDRAIQALIASAPSSYRTIEPRLSGFRWAELRRLRGNELPPGDAAELKLAGTAGDVLAQTSTQDTASSRHAAGLAFLLVRNVDRAMEQLRGATAQDPRNGAAWNDLAAALYANAVQQRRPEDLPEALAVADRAIALGRAPEALFNRALILERLGLDREAERAWRQYLASEHDSSWAAEGNEHLRALTNKPQTSFRDRIAVIEIAAKNDDRGVLDSELARFSQEMRGWFEADVLGRWGEAELRGDREAARELLQAAHNMGRALQARSGESLLLDAVAAIETPKASRAGLPAAHAAYRAGRLAYRDRRLQDAEQLLRRADAALAHAGSPMAAVARAYTAAVLFDRNRIDAAAETVVQAGSAAVPTHIALRAQAALLLGRCDAYAHRWAPALRHFAEAKEGFLKLTEISNSAEAEEGLAEVLANAGDNDRAWQHRIEALHWLGAGAGSPRLVAALASISRGELRNQRWLSAEAMSGLEIAEARQTADPLLIADAYKRRALLQVQLGRHEPALQDLSEARAMASHAPSSGLRDRFLAECSLVDGVSWRAIAPARSLASFDTAVAFAKTADDRRMIPEALLERARSLRALGRNDDAWNDLKAGVTEIEDRRTTAEGGPGATFDSAVDLFHEAISLLLEQSRNSEAFDYAERALARGLWDAVAKAEGRMPSSSVTASELVRVMPPETALDEYVSLRDALVVFRVDQRGVRVVHSEVPRRAIEADVRRLRALLQQRAPIAEVQATSARLYTALIAPLDALGGEEIASRVIVGDRLLQAIPWAALWDAKRKEYLLERSEISVAPSATIWSYRQARNHARTRSAVDCNRLLLVTADGGAGIEALERVGREANGIAAFYPDRLLLRDSAATPARMLEESRNADVIHYAGHARESRGTVEAALLFGQERELTASRIASAQISGVRLVVLGACDTIAGDSDDLEGSPDLARAFLAAGVETVVGTLWPVQDADAARLFVAFHRRLRSAGRAAAALREAQLEVLHSSQGTAHPSSWAVAEVMGGSPSSLQSRSLRESSTIGKQPTPGRRSE